MRHSARKTLLLATVAVVVAGSSIAGLAQIVDTQMAAQGTGAQAGEAGQVQAAGAGQTAVAAPPQICGNTAYCYETNDFAATITSFRVSTDGYKRQILDLSVRFQNKTNQQLVLGYVNGSGNASDDRGNRLVPYGANAYRGLGLVAGSSFDPKFALRPAGFGDAQFEFFPQGWPQVVGFTYTLDLSIAEINTFEGNQHTLGEEFPLHFQGLRNGSAGISPSFVPGGGFNQAASYAPGAVANGMANPCAAAGSLGQGAGQAASTVSNAANAISNLGSIFHRKKTQNAGQATTNVGGCDPNAAAGLPAPAAVTTAIPSSTTSTNPLQQAVSRTTVPAAASNPLDPLASTPAPMTTPAVVNATAQTRTAVANSANTQAAVAAHSSAARGSARPAASATKPASVAAGKPSPAKPLKRQPPKPQDASATAQK